MALRPSLLGDVAVVSEVVMVGAITITKVLEVDVEATEEDMVAVAADSVEVGKEEGGSFRGSY